MTGHSFSISQNDVHDWIHAQRQCQQSLRDLQACFDDLEAHIMTRRLKSQIMLAHLRTERHVKYTHSNALAASMVLCLMLAGCQNVKVEQDDSDFRTRVEKRDEGMGKIFGEEGLHFSEGNARQRPSELGVNAYLWRACLDVLSFLPLQISDPFGGVISTDWYQFDPKSDARVKVDVLILDRALTVSALKVTIHQQTLQSGRWMDQATPLHTMRELEDIILTRARTLKSSASY